jgi:hypothetical protein
MLQQVNCRMVGRVFVRRFFEFFALHFPKIFLKVLVIQDVLKCHGIIGDFLSNSFKPFTFRQVSATVKFGSDVLEFGSGIEKIPGK